MYFLSKFCRICVQTGVELNDIEMIDFDSIKLSEKLKTCARLVVTENSVCSQICNTCANKLRVSYHFQEMCNKSTKILQVYLAKLTEYSDISAEVDNFKNWDLEVAVTPLPRLGIVTVAEQIQKTSENYQVKDFENSPRESEDLLLNTEQLIKIQAQTVEIGEESRPEVLNEPISAEVKKNDVFSTEKTQDSEHLLLDTETQSQKMCQDSEINKNSQNQPIYTEVRKVAKMPTLKTIKLYQESKNFLLHGKKLAKMKETNVDIDQESQNIVKNFQPIYTEILKLVKIPTLNTQEFCQESIITIKEEPMDTEDTIVAIAKSASPSSKNQNVSQENPVRVKKYEPIPTEVIKFGKMPKPRQKTFLENSTKVNEFTGTFPQTVATTQNPHKSCLEGRIRVKNFDNEPIQNQAEPVANQNVLSDIEKVVNDVPATFKKQHKSRITKEKRCSLLKQLLTPSPTDKHKKERDKGLGLSCSEIKKEEDGLKGILNFTENYRFALKNASSNFSDKDFNTHSSHIDKLKEFSQNYFKRKSFQEFKNTVMYIIEHKDDYDDCSFDESDVEDDDELVNETDEDTDTAEEADNFEEVLVEPDIGVENRSMDCEEDTQSTFDYVVDANFDDELGLIESDKEPIDDPDEQPQTSTKHIDDQLNSETIKNVKVKEEPRTEHTDYLDNVNPSGIRVKPEFVELSELRGLVSSDEGECSSKNSEDKGPSPGPSSYGFEFESYLSKYTSDSVNMLDQLVSNYPMGKKVFSPSNVRCRTRGQPYISPRLMDQFKFQCFRCEKCNRNFKSPGYLKAHTSKVH